MVKTSKRTHVDGIITSHGESKEANNVSLLAFTMTSHNAIAMY
jgi:hypothetical protein